jgi:putative membrane-bound dehydrogenase-like protein
MKNALPLCLLAVSLLAAEPPKPPIVNDTALKIELLASYPEVEACTTVCGAPDGSIYVGNDPRDGRLSNKEPVNTIVRFSGMGADKKRTVFADKIYSPAGSAWFDGYLYVLHDPLLTRFKDTDGDGIADVREDLVTNLGIPPTEGLNDHVVSGFTLGMDGFFYISVGDRGIFEAKSVKDGSTITMRGGGIVRCRTDGTQLEIFSTGTRNHLQVNLDAEDNAFTRDNTDDGNGWWTRLTHHIEGGFYGYPYLYRTVPNYGVVQPSQETLNAIKQHGGTVDRTATMSDGRKVADVVPDVEAALARSAVPPASVPRSASAGEKSEAARPTDRAASTFLPAMADFGGGSPTGGLCYLSDGLPEQYRGRHFFSEWGKAGVFVTEVARDGATFKLVSDTKLIEPEKGADFRPMQLSVAADGSLLIADWGYGGWKSPRVAGAIWRLSWPEAKIAPRLKDESKASVEELLAALGHPDRDQRLRAQAEVSKRALAEFATNKDWPSRKIARAVHSTITDSRDVLKRMHALWAWAPVIKLEQEGERGPSTGGNAGAAMSLVFHVLTEEHNTTLAVQVMRALGTARGLPWILDEANLHFDPAVRLELATRSAAQGWFTKSGAQGFFTAGYEKLLGDADPWVRFAARTGLRNHIARQFPAVGNASTKKDVEVLAAALRSADPVTRESAWLVFPPSLDSAIVHALRGDKFTERLANECAKVLSPLLTDADAPTRARAVAALGRIAYQPAPYDGHWWGTQPVKSPPPLNSVPWAGTPQALAALTAALSDPDAGVRLAAAKAFSQFIMPAPAPVAAPGAAAAALSPTADGFFTDRQRLFQGPSAAFAPAVGGFSTHRRRLSAPPSSAFSPTVGTFLPTVGGRRTPKQATTYPQKADDVPPKSRRRTSEKPATVSEEGVTFSEKGAAIWQKRLAHEDGAVSASQKATLLAAAAVPSELKAAAGVEKADPALDQAVAAALTALRTRLTAETDLAVRRQLIEALGVQKDPQAMDVFLKIALDEKAEAEFRDTAIGAVVNIGGDGAKKVIGQLAAAPLSPGATRKIITAAGELKVMEAAPALIAHLKDADAGNREFAARSLQQLGPKSGAGPALIEVLADKDGKAQAAAIDAVGSFREKAALPALIALAEKKRSMKETIGALANMPDESAIPVLVETLREKNTSVRRNALKALKAMRDQAWPQVEALLATGRVPEELVPEIRNAFESGAITQWKMVGVFENVWDAVHPPEQEMLAAFAQVSSKQKPVISNPAASAPLITSLLARKYHNAEGKDVGWIDVTADGAEGRVNLESVFKSNAMVCAYAFTEIDAPEAAEARLFTSADDEIAVWLNGAQVLNVSGNHGYEPDKNETPLALQAGKNQLFVKIGNKGGSWVFHARVPGYEDGKFIKSKETPPDEKQRLFALAARPDGTYVNKGDAAKGEKIFFDPTGPLGGICATCHAVKGKGGQVGPDLGTIAANYKRPDLIVSLHEPSKTIALGFEQVMVETKGGEIFAGALRQETADALTVVGADAQPHVVKKAEVKAKTAVPVSLMPQGLTLGLKPQDFTDLLAYLETLKGN